MNEEKNVTLPRQFLKAIVTQIHELKTKLVKEQHYEWGATCRDIEKQLSEIAGIDYKILNSKKPK